MSPGSTRDISDDVRLGFAKTLLTKAEGADAATAERIANAANAILGPVIAHADDAKGDAEVKNKVLEKSAKKADEDEKPRKAAD